MSGDKLRVSRAALHFWEEPCISGTAGSGAVFFSGCNLRCVYCQNCDISSGGVGREMNDDAVIRAFDRLVEQGAHNINLVTPTHFVHRLASLLEKYNSPVPVVYNCGGYESVETLRRLDGLVDIYLPDFKYADNTLALAFSNAPDYFERACEAIAEMNRQVGTLTLDDNGVADRKSVV